MKVAAFVLRRRACSTHRIRAAARTSSTRASDPGTRSPTCAGAIAAIVKAQTEPAWIGYAVPALNNDRSGRNDGWSERCRLEQQRVDPATNTAVQGPIRLEPAPTAMVLVRVQASEIRRVRPVSGDCQVDAGGLPLSGWATSTARKA